MNFNKVLKAKREIKDSYLDDDIPILSLDIVNENQLKYSHQQFDEKMKEKYSISSEIMQIHKKIEEEFSKNNKKTYIHPPTYKLKGSPPKTSIFNDKSSQTINPIFLTAQKPLQYKNSDPNIIPAIKRPFSSENRSLVLKNDSFKSYQNKKNTVRSNYSNEFLTSNDINDEILLAKSLILKGKYREAEGKLKPLISRGINHADVYYLFGECKRLQGMYEILTR